MAGSLAVRGAVSEVENVQMASLLHDIGKVGVAMTTLHKPMKLTASEYDLVKLHPVMGARILAGLDIRADLLPPGVYHHEWVDGTGYPDGLVGDDIPLGARVIAVADVYDALMNDRPYRAAVSEEEAVEHLEAAAGAQLDRALVRLWVQCPERGREDGTLCEAATPERPPRAAHDERPAPPPTGGGAGRSLGREARGPGCR